MSIRFSPGPCGCCHQYLLALRWVAGNTETLLFKLSVNGTIMSGISGDQFALHDQQIWQTWATDAGLATDNTNMFQVFTPQNQGLPVGGPNLLQSQAFHDALRAPGLNNFSIVGWPNTAAYEAILFGLDPFVGAGLRWKIIAQHNQGPSPLQTQNFSFTINSDGTIA